jgi:TRAP-type C4-dicarboxylate transport system substrate-binding protein
VLQWFTKARYITDNPFGYAYGVFLLDKKKFDKLPPKYATIIRESAAKHFSVLIDETRKSNDESYLVLKQQGVTFVKANPDSLAELQTFRQKTIDTVMGSAFSEAGYTKMMQILKSYRATHKGRGN